MLLEKIGRIETRLVKEIKSASLYLNKRITIMEVCGTHTMSIYKYGIKSILPDNIKLISGPGCPVCVTPPGYIERAVEVAGCEDVIICTFGDMIRVPGTKGTLEDARSRGADIRIVYSPLECLKVARENPEKKVVLLAVGFETTAPVIGLSLKHAEEQGIDNFLILSGIKQLFPALEVLFGSGAVNIDGLICPGHVSAVTGEQPYRFISDKYKIPCVIAGFEASDVLAAVYLLVLQHLKEKALVQNAYKRAGTVKGNTSAMNIIQLIFSSADDSWRGLGVIPGSGLEPAEQYRHMDAWRHFGIKRPIWEGDGACRCGDVIKGAAEPAECPLFREVCTPQNPVGACMVSSEGTCSAYYKYS